MNFVSSPKARALCAAIALALGGALAGQAQATILYNSIISGQGAQLGSSSSLQQITFSGGTPVSLNSITFKTFYPSDLPTTAPAVEFNFWTNVPYSTTVVNNNVLGSATLLGTIESPLSISSGTAFTTTLTTTGITVPSTLYIQEVYYTDSTYTTIEANNAADGSAQSNSASVGSNPGWLYVDGGLADAPSDGIYDADEAIGSSPLPKGGTAFVKYEMAYTIDATAVPTPEPASLGLLGVSALHSSAARAVATPENFYQLF